MHNVILAAMISFILGAALALQMVSSIDIAVEKRGVWTIGDRAYRLVRIDPKG